MSKKSAHPSPAAAALAERKAKSRAYLRSRPPEEKIRILMDLQEHYYEFLKLREINGGKPVPERWIKWRAARQTGVTHE